MRISSFTVAIVVVTLLLLGFLAGWLVFRPHANEVSQQGPTTVEEPSQPSAAEVVVPPEDVSGVELPGLPRYPGSVRIEYRREDVGDLIVTEAEYLIVEDVEPVREFYRDVFRRNDWSVGDLGFSRGEWVFFVINEEREALIEIEERGKVVEIELELSEPAPEKTPQDAPPPRTEQEPRGSGPPPTPQPTPVQPAPQPAPIQPAPQPAPAQPAPPVYDDDDGYEAPDDDLENDDLGSDD